MAASYSPALHCSTIGAGGLNFSVRNGKRWDPAAITTWKSMQGERNAKALWALTSRNSISTPCQMGLTHFTQELPASTTKPLPITVENMRFTAKAFGQLVQLGFDVAVFTPAAYQRRSLRRPSWSPNLVAGFALRCFQRLSDPDADTRRCTWRYNRHTGGRSTTVLSY